MRKMCDDTFIIYYYLLLWCEYFAVNSKQLRADVKSDFTLANNNA